MHSTRDNANLTLLPPVPHNQPVNHSGALQVPKSPNPPRIRPHVADSDTVQQNVSIQKNKTAVEIVTLWKHILNKDRGRIRECDYTDSADIAQGPVKQGPM